MDKDELEDLVYEVENLKHWLYVIYKNLPDYGSLRFDTSDYNVLADQIVRELHTYEKRKEFKNDID